ncbi:UDP-glucose:glycoprotein glucosyltransferase 1 [Trichinella murrelli]|uniref:UDP-glucose:glycoprotein glucosyltransferase 1 n=1 Tax=Trichinella murrelli TaxID=144512 RepID=A0A0V0TGM6_9BILA|nr:UDP-glucose:glycoprotein glucosyltransferase 1 [Trichinella murrelli]
MWVFPLIVVCFVSPVLVSPRKAHKNVIVSVRSKWPSTSLIMEASEFMSKESNEKFWQFIEAVIDKHQNSLGNKTDREVYNGILQIGDQILKSKARLEFLKLALTVRVHSATVEMHRQIAATSLDVQNGKSVYAVVHGKQISDLQQLDTILKHAEALARPVTYEFDHIYPGSKQGSVCVLLYADIENPHFKPWHLQLKKLVQRDGISYILRHYPKMNDDMVALSGYAVELAIKSTEYKAVDDSDKQTGSESGVSSSEEEVTDLNGFNLHLLEADELTPLKVWQLQHLSFQAGQRVILAPKEEALRVLRDISQNFPIMARKDFTLLYAMKGNDPNAEYAVDYTQWSPEIFVLRLGDRASQNLLSTAYQMYEHVLPIRIGFIFVVNNDKSVSGYDDAGVAMLNAFNFIKEDRSVSKAVMFLIKIYNTSMRETISVEDVHKLFKSSYRDENLKSVFNSEEYNQGRSISPEHIEEAILSKVMRFTVDIQKDVYEGNLKENMDVQQHLLKKPTVLPKLNYNILQMENIFLDMTDTSMDMRIALIHNPKSEAQATKGTASLVQACIQFLPLYQSKAVIGKIFANKITTLEDLINVSPSGISWPEFKKAYNSMSDIWMQLHVHYAKFVLNLDPGVGAIVANGKIEASDPTAAQFDIVAIVDPLSPAAQKMSHLLVILSSVLNVHMKVCMNCKSKLSEIPLKNFFRMVLPRELEFADDGSLKAQPSARFSALPQKQLFTLNIIAPQSWMVESVEAVYDLDNIKMEEVKGDVVAKFQLEYILLEGRCFDERSGSPPRGLQFTLGTFHEPFMFDTIVMANLVAKKNDQLENELLAESEDAESESLWQSISKTFQSGEKYDVINIFSLASGHLYERFLRIMMLSVLKHTKTAVKFWLLKNYLSPGFKEFLPYMAGHYNFSYELVQYKWPRWLHQQTEKQRIMWGYKILFLDVLFPLDVKKIIFVDADQVVRTDMLNLMELDLEGAPYAYTPFCDSRKEMDGYRFWKQGYWENHLAGRKYHISALYVVDLKKFRQVAAGDRLRGQYHFLSRDPNSLSNLDQDLPNNMIHQVKIKSLPQEWLWCETWCDDKSKKFAKTIDLCNNPMTKEPKLQSAMRIIEEWKDYDSEIKDLLDQRTKDKWNITEQKIVDIGFQFTAYFLVFLEESWNRAMNKENQVQDNRKAEITRDDLPQATRSINNATEMKARQRGMIEKKLRKYVVGIKNQNSLIKLRIMPANSLGTLRLSNRRLSKRVLESCFAGLKCFPAYYSDQKVKNDSVDCSRNRDKFKNYYRKHWDTDITVEDETVVGLKNRILKGDRSALASAITLVESNHPTKRAQGECLLQSMLKISKKRFDEHGPKSLIFRIAITGAPGAGKSTFIESFGLYLTRELKKKIAVLTIDPSSVRTGGSIMGDVARMNELSKEPNCYIRPSATAGTLGGVRRGTHESVVLCEGAGYDVVLIETVGVGQSESAVANIADMVVLLLSPALGDELQGIKRGIMEMADLILVTKADGDLLNQARLTRAEFSSALKYSRSRFHCWRPQVLLVSSRTNKGITEIWNEMEHFRNALSENGVLLQQRHQQMLRWMWNHIDHVLSGLFRHHPDVVKMLPQLIREIQNDNVTPVTADFVELDWQSDVL